MEENKDKEMYQEYIKTLENLIDECNLNIELSQRQIEISKKNIKNNKSQKRLYNYQIKIAKNRINNSNYENTI